MKEANNLPIGVQLWSLKNDLAKNADETLKAVSAAGFSHVETAGYDFATGKVQGLEPLELLKKLKNYQLQWVSAHLPLAVENVQSVLGNLTGTGISYIVCSMYPGAERTIEDYKKIAEGFNMIGKIAKPFGITFCYHNHHFEFEEIGGEIPFNILLQHTDPNLVAFEIDLGWAVSAGANPIEYFEKYSGRFPLWHLRDSGTETASQVIGKGVVDIKKIYAFCKEAGYKYGFVETPSSAPNGMELVLQAADYLQKNIKS